MPVDINNPSSTPNRFYNGFTQCAEQVAQIAANKAADYLINDAKNQLNELLTQQRVIEESSSHLSLLMQRYQLKTSQLSQYADWYAQQPWYEKAYWGTLLMSFSALMGAVFNLAALFTLVSGTILYALTFLLQEHHDITLERDTRFCEDIRMMEARLAASIDTLKTLENALRNKLIELSEKNTQSAEHIKHMETHLNHLTHQIHRFEDTILLMEIAQTASNNENAKIRALLEAALIDAQQAKDARNHQTDELIAIQHQLQDTQARLSTKTDDFSVLCDTIQTDSETLSTLKAGFQTQLSRLQTDVDAHCQSIETASQTTQQQPTTQQVLAESKRVLDDALSRRVARQAALSDLTARNESAVTMEYIQTTQLTK